MAGFELDTSELRRLEGDLGRIPARAADEAEKVLKKAANSLKEEMTAAFESSDSFSGRGLRISYDRFGFASEIGYEIGPERGGAGSLAHIAVDGGANGGGGSVDIDHLLEPEAVKIGRFIGDILEDLL